MISREELEALAQLYDQGHQNLDPLSKEAVDARREIDRQLEAAYSILFPGRSVTFYEFKCDAIRRMKAFLRRS